MAHATGRVLCSAAGAPCNGICAVRSSQRAGAQARGSAWPGLAWLPALRLPSPLPLGSKGTPACKHSGGQLQREPGWQARRRRASCSPCAGCSVVHAAAAGQGSAQSACLDACMHVSTLTASTAAISGTVSAASMQCCRRIGRSSVAPTPARACRRVISAGHMGLQPAVGWTGWTLVGMGTRVCWPRAASSRQAHTQALSSC